MESFAVGHITILEIYTATSDKWNLLYILTFRIMQQCTACYIELIIPFDFIKMGVWLTLFLVNFLINRNFWNFKIFIFMD